MVGELGGLGELERWKDGTVDRAICGEFQKVQKEGPSRALYTLALTAQRPPYVREANGGD